MEQQIPAWLGIPCLLLVVAFIAFAFRQGFRVKPQPGDNSASDAIALTRDSNQHRP
jgi:hypothetical protein